LTEEQRAEKLNRVKGKLKERRQKEDALKKAKRIKVLPPGSQSSGKKRPRSSGKGGRVFEVEEEIGGIVFKRKVFVPAEGKPKTRKQRILAVFKRGLNATLMGVKLKAKAVAASKRASLQPWA
jgi:hypothetical protein